MSDAERKSGAVEAWHALLDAVAGEAASEALHELARTFIAYRAARRTSRGDVTEPLLPGLSATERAHWREATERAWVRARLEVEEDLIGSAFAVAQTYLVGVFGAARRVSDSRGAVPLKKRQLFKYNPAAESPWACTIDTIANWWKHRDEWNAADHVRALDAKARTTPDHRTRAELELLGVVDPFGVGGLTKAVDRLWSGFAPMKLWDTAGRWGSIVSEQVRADLAGSSLFSPGTTGGA